MKREIKELIIERDYWNGIRANTEIIFLQSN